MRDVYILGMGMSKFGRLPDATLEDLVEAAVPSAIQDSGISPKMISTVYVAHTNQGRVAGQSVLRNLGLTGMPIVNIENACTSGSSAFHLAWQSVAGGFNDVALVLGMEKMSKGLIPPNRGEYEQRMGKPLPAKYALRAQKHMAQYGTTIEQLAMISVKNHANGCLNPYAQYHTKFTLEEVLNSRPVVDPLTLYQCCPTSEGAAAIIICSEEILKKLTLTGPKVKVKASVLRSGAYANPITDELSPDDDLTVRAAQAAYEKAGVGPADIDVVEVHDAFTIGELLAYENLGLCPRGEGGRWVEEGNASLGGKQPVNPSGGLMSRGHPLGATGVAQLCQLSWQLRGQAGDSQVERAKLAMAQCVGGSTPGIGSASCTVHILETC